MTLSTAELFLLTWALGASWFAANQYQRVQSALFIIASLLEKDSGLKIDRVEFADLGDKQKK